MGRAGELPGDRRRPAFLTAPENTLVIEGLQLLFAFPEPLLLAIVVVATVPILIVYPFLQTIFHPGRAHRRDQGLTRGANPDLKEAT